MRQKYLTYGATRKILPIHLDIERYSQKRRGSLRRRLGYVMWLAVICCLCWLGYTHINLALMDIIVLENSRVSDQYVLECSQIQLDTPVWRLSVQQIRENLRECAGIKDANVRVILPNRLEIEVSEMEPRAVWWHNSKLHVVDRDGDLVVPDVSKADFPDLALIFGDGANKCYKEVIAELEQQHLSVSYMRFIHQRRWDVMLTDGTLLRLPEHDPAAAVTLWCKLVESISEGPARPWVVDLRLLPDKVFIKTATTKASSE